MSDEAERHKEKMRKRKEVKKPIAHCKQSAEVSVVSGGISRGSE